MPRPEETQVLMALVKKHRAQFADKPEEAKKLLAIGDAVPPKDVKPFGPCSKSDPASSIPRQ